jgi:hypothetical protein
MAKQKFTHFVPRAKPRKRPGRHKKRLNKSEKRQKKKQWYELIKKVSQVDPKDHLQDKQT